MKVIKIDLPKELKSVEIHTLADLHIGDKFCDMNEIKAKIEHIIYLNGTKKEMTATL